MKIGEPKSNILKQLLNKVPYSEELQETADAIATNASDSLKDGKMGGVEAAGHLSLASLLAGVSNGDLPLKQAFPLLKTIADKKTPAPVQKIEQRTELDMRAIIVEAVAKNNAALTENVAIALAAREQVRINLGATDNRLELKALPKATVPGQDDEPEVRPDQGLDSYSYDLRELGIIQTDVSAIVTEANKDWKPGEAPSEIIKLQGGD